MIDIKFDSENHSLTITGHANYAEEGKDIVCAAVSILFYTVCGCMNEEYLEEKIDMKIEKGDSFLHVVPKEEYLPNVDLVFATVVTGFTLLAKVYPEHVALTVK